MCGVTAIRFSFLSLLLLRLSAEYASGMLNVCIRRGLVKEKNEEEEDVEGAVASAVF